MLNKKGIVLLGSTGSIGTQTIDLADKKGIKISALSAHKNVKLAEAQVRRLKPDICAMAEEKAANELKIALAEIVPNSAITAHTNIKSKQPQTFNIVIKTFALRADLILCKLISDL